MESKISCSLFFLPTAKLVWEQELYSSVNTLKRFFDLHQSYFSISPWLLKICLSKTNITSLRVYVKNSIFFFFLISKIYRYQKGNTLVHREWTKGQQIKNENCKNKKRRIRFVLHSKQPIQQSSKKEKLEVRNRSLNIFKTTTISFPPKTPH